MTFILITIIISSITFLGVVVAAAAAAIIFISRPIRFFSAQSPGIAQYIYIYIYVCVCVCVCVYVSKYVSKQL